MKKLILIAFVLMTGTASAASLDERSDLATCAVNGIVEDDVEHRTRQMHYAGQGDLSASELQDFNSYWIVGLTLCNPSWVIWGAADKDQVSEYLAAALWVRYSKAVALRLLAEEKEE